MVGYTLAWAGAISSPRTAPAAWTGATPQLRCRHNLTVVALRQLAKRINLT
jgi:hypothetical protein